MYFQDGGATWRPTLEPLTHTYPYPYPIHVICIFNGILYTHKNTLLLERIKYTLMSTHIFERTKCFLAKNKLKELHSVALSAIHAT